MRWSILRPLAVFLALIALAGAPARGADAAPIVTAAATDEPAVFEFLATGFRANEAVSTWVTGPREQVQATSGHEADGRGEVAFRLRLPRHFEPGRWAITVHGLRSGQQGIAHFTLPERGPDLTLTASPGSGPAGTAFAFAAGGFRGGEAVHFWLTGPDGRAYAGGRATAGGDGSVAFRHAIGSGAQPGRWAMSAYGMRSDRLGVAAFIVD